MNRSKIPWLVNADGTPGYTWSPTSGCSPASAGCANCWAKAYHVRYRGGDFGVKLHPEKLDEPLRLRKPSTIGVCLMGDLLHDDVPAEFILAVFGIMAAAEQHRFIVLTKRPKGLRSLFAGTGPASRLESCWEALRMEVEHHPLGDGGPMHTKWAADPDGPWPLPNVYLGTSVEDQPTADDRIAILLDTPAAHRWVSLEPQIGAVSFDEEWMMGLDWIVQGCESGPRRRPFDIAWARSVRDDCAASGTAYYFKQAPGTQCKGDGWPSKDVVSHPILDGRTHLALPWVTP